MYIVITAVCVLRKVVGWNYSGVQ